MYNNQPYFHVVLTFYFGGDYYENLDEYRLNGDHDFPDGFDLRFENDIGNEIVIKHIDDNFISDKYRCTLVYDEKWCVKDIEYNHCEEIKIPSELFLNDHGSIYFGLWGKNIRQDQKTEMPFVGAWIYYKVVDEKVILSNKPIQ